jgi:monoamine oxidase
MHDVIIIGAGAAGLTAAHILSGAGKRVLVLEARPYCGGRTLTLPAGRFSFPVETGAEFIHGDLPETKKLLDTAGQSYHVTDGELWRVERGALAQEDSFNEGADIVVPRLESLDTDITVEAFFNKFFNDPLYRNLLQEIRGYVEGYDAGDISRASAFALRDEWGGEEESDQYRTDLGYSAMIAYLEEESRKSGAEIVCNTVVKKISHKSGLIKAFTAGREYDASAVLITVPLGILQASPDTEAFIEIENLPNSHRNAIAQLGFGSVIKILLEFHSSFWKEDAELGLQNLGWLFSTEEVPTWWTQSPREIPLLTGWLAGPGARAMSAMPEEEIIKRALQSLSAILKISIEDLHGMLTASAVFNWTADPFTLGAYAYSTPETGKALEVMQKPVEGKLFFAGEAFHNGPQMGTVEGAIISGQEAAKAILAVI